MMTPKGNFDPGDYAAHSHTGISNDGGGVSGVPPQLTRDLVRIERIELRQAENGLISYLPLRVLRNRRHLIHANIRLIPHRTKLPEVVLRLERLDTTNRSEPKQEITLGEDELYELMRYIRSASALRGQPSGSYLLIRLDGGAGHDLDVDVSALSAFLRSPDIASALQTPEVAETLADTVKGAVRLAELRMATDELEGLLGSGEAREGKYQDWLERHTWALGNAYVRRDAVRRISAADDIDILMQSALSGLRDVYELKRPDMPVLNYDREHNTLYWSHHVAKAIGQCHRYLDVLHDKLRSGLDDHPEVIAYHPRAIIVLGRSQSWDQKWTHALHGLNARLHGVTVMTYDQLLAQCWTLLSHVDQ